MALQRSTVVKPSLDIKFTCMVQTTTTVSIRLNDDACWPNTANGHGFTCISHNHCFNQLLCHCENILRCSFCLTKANKECINEKQRNIKLFIQNIITGKF